MDSEPKNIAPQALFHRNELSVAHLLSTIHVPEVPPSQYKYTRDMRRVHPTCIGYMDIMHSVDSGQRVGMVRKLSIVSTIDD